MKKIKLLLIVNFMCRPFLLVLGFFVIVNFSFVFGSSCCGNQGAKIDILDGLKLTHIEFQYLYYQTQGRMGSLQDGYVKWSDKDKNIHVVRIGINKALDNQNQLFVNVRWIENFYKDPILNGHFSNWGDGQGGWSFLINEKIWSNDLISKVYGSLFINIPWGSPYFLNPQDPEGISVTGYGQWGGGLSLTGQVQFEKWKGQFQLKRTRLIESKISNTHVSSFWEETWSTFVYYDFIRMQISAGVIADKVWDRHINSVLTDRVTVSSLYLGLSKKIDQRFLVNLNFIDQGLLGPTENSYVNKGVGVSFSYLL